MDEQPPAYTENAEVPAQTPAYGQENPAYPPTAGPSAYPQPAPSAEYPPPQAGYPQPNMYPASYPPLSQQQQQAYMMSQPQQITVVTQQPNNSTSGIRQAIPELPMALAVCLLIVNIILPGVGTIIAGASVFCCGNIGASGSSKLGTFCINFWVGIAQLFTVWIFLLGWVWSIMWGVAFIAVSGAAASNQTIVTHQQVITVAQPMVNQPTDAVPMETKQ